MRLPWGSLDFIEGVFIKDRHFSMVGCLSFEERCCRVPMRLNGFGCDSIEMIEITDPVDAYPDYSADIALRVQQNALRLREAGVTYAHQSRGLLDTEDSIIAASEMLLLRGSAEIMVFDITAFPKRYFGLILKRLLQSDVCRNLIVTYTYPGYAGHAVGHLAEDSMTCDHLPGYAPPYSRPPSPFLLAVSVGFEPLNIRSILETYREKEMRLLLPFPPNGESSRRVWSTLKNLANDDADDVRMNNIEVVAAWDAGAVYRVLRQWRSGCDGLNLAPFGPKPHSLGMFLFAIEDDSGMFYTQPKAYNPYYSTGHGPTWAYVAKWQGIPCYQRREHSI